MFLQDEMIGENIGGKGPIPLPNAPVTNPQPDVPEGTQLSLGSSLSHILDKAKTVKPAIWYALGALVVGYVIWRAK